MTNPLASLLTNSARANTQEFTAMNFEKKSIVLSPEDITNFRSLLDQLNVSRHKCQEVMVRLSSRYIPVFAESAITTFSTRI